MKKTRFILIVLGLLLAQCRPAAAEGLMPELFLLYAFNKPDNADLESLTVSEGALSPKFSAGTTEYAVIMVMSKSIVVSANSKEKNAELHIDGDIAGRKRQTHVKEFNLDKALVTTKITVTAPNGRNAKTYTLTFVDFHQQAYIKASNTGSSDFFGWSVSLSGDTLAVGAYLEDSNARGVKPGGDGSGAEADNSAGNSGAVYVFERKGTTWTQQAYIKASNTEAIDNFGISVALDGDFLAVGAKDEDSEARSVTYGAGYSGTNGAAGSGAVYLFRREVEVWRQVSYNKASNTGGGDFFGWSVALSGGTLAAGAIFESGNATGVKAFGDGTGVEANDDALNSGAVYVFK